MASVELRHRLADLWPAASAAHQRGDLRVRRQRAVHHVVLRGPAHLSTRLFCGPLAAFTFWGWQIVIVAAAITLPLGYTSSKEYAELEWPIDILITLVWVAYAIVFFGTIIKRRSKHIYVANWFFGSYILTIAILHIFNNLEVPVSMWKSYSAYAGVQDAMVQWWYGHNAVGFFLTTSFLGMMYYFVPKPSDLLVPPVHRPLLGAGLHVHVGGPHHLLYTSLPDWTQSLGMTFSLILLAPSWGGMINGIMTLQGAWYKLRTDPILKFMVTALSFYGMSTFEGSMMSIRTVNALSHYTDWTIGHVHSGALGWVAMISFGSLYYLIPRLYGREKMHSVKAIELHFWIATIGVVLYIAAMWIAGVQQGLMWRDTAADGTLVYSFVEELKTRVPYYLIRLLGGTLFLSGVFVMAWNVWMTVRGATAVNPPFPRTIRKPRARSPPPLRLPFDEDIMANKQHGFFSHQTLEKNIGWMIIASILVVSFAGLVQIIPLFFQHSTTQAAEGVEPTAPAPDGPRHLHPRGLRRLPFPAGAPAGGRSAALRFVLAGLGIGVRPSVPVGFKRTGPDLARLGERYSDEWHRIHLRNPRMVVPESTCRPIRGWRRPRSPARTCRTACAPCAWWACRTATRKSPPRPRPSRARRKRTRWWPPARAGRGRAQGAAGQEGRRRRGSRQEGRRRRQAAGRPAGLGRLIMAYISAIVTAISMATFSASSGGPARAAARAPTESAMLPFALPDEFGPAQQDGANRS